MKPLGLGQTKGDDFNGGDSVVLRAKNCLANGSDKGCVVAAPLMGLWGWANLRSMDTMVAVAKNVDGEMPAILDLAGGPLASQVLDGGGKWMAQ